MARVKRTSAGEGAKDTSAPATTDAEAVAKPGPKLPSPVASTNLVIADIVLRAAGGLLREQMERGLLTRHYDKRKADKLVDKRGIAASAVLWGASRLARRSPIGLAVIAGGLAAKVFYDRGKRVESKSSAQKPPKGET